MNRVPFISAVCALLLWLSAAPAFAFTYGVCGHQLYGGPVWSAHETQFATLNQRNLTTYRFDVPLSDDKLDAPEALQSLAALADQHHITLHPVLAVPFTWGDNATDNGKYPATEAGLEAQGYNRVYPLALRFASQIHDWELQNELTLKEGMKKGVGQSPEDFETPKARQWAAVLRGMSKAVRDAAAKTKQPLRVCINIVYVDFGFVPFLERNGVSVDKISYHYYYHLGTDPRKVSAPNGIFDIFQELKRLGKPVIVNEFNAAEIYSPINEKKPYDDAKALRSLKKHLEAIISQKDADIEGVEFYELYDEPGKDVVESNFGLMKDAQHPKAQMLLVSAFTGGALSAEEKQTIDSLGLWE